MKTNLMMIKSYFKGWNYITSIDRKSKVSGEDRRNHNLEPKLIFLKKREVQKQNEVFKKELQIKSNVIK